MGMLYTPISEYGQKGLQLPVVDGLSLLNPNITLGEVRLLFAYTVTCCV